MATVKTKKAFDAFRETRPPKELPKDMVANEDQVRRMVDGDGLLVWEDGPLEAKTPEPEERPAVTAEQESGKMLWVVRPEDVVYAPEKSDFGSKLESGVIKHSNLTGGAAAYCGGEILLIDEQTIVINGRSGRYGPKSGDELSEVAACFRASGYSVWNMGFDDEVGFPRPFIGATPEWID